MGDGDSVEPSNLTHKAATRSRPGAALQRTSAEQLRPSSRSAFRPYADNGGDPASNEQQATAAPGAPGVVKRLSSQLVKTYRQCAPGPTPAPAAPKRVLTKPGVGVKNDGIDNDNNDLIMCVNDVLVNSEGQKYVVLDMLGQGTFGQVAACWSEHHGREVAVKVIKNQPAFFQQARVEVGVLRFLNTVCDADDQHHIVRMHDFFLFRRHLCVVFEKLDMNLFDLLKRNQFRGLSLNLLRLLLRQIIDSLIVLRDASVIHCDLKPENILLKSQHSGEIKVIDFGSACFEDRTVYSYIQSRFYRSPEVVLGLSYNVAIDVWSLGCVAAELFLGLPLFPGASEHDLLVRIVEMMGLPPPWMLGAAKHADKFFKRKASQDADGSQGTSYVLLTQEEFEARNSCKAPAGKRYFKHASLPDIISVYPTKSGLSDEELSRERTQREAFIDFLLGVLDVDPKNRWSPRQAAQHPFITGEPFTGPYQPMADVKVPQYYAREEDGAAMRSPVQSGSSQQQSGWVMGQAASFQSPQIMAVSPAHAAQAHAIAMQALQQLSPQFSQMAAAAAATPGSRQNPGSLPGSLPGTPQQPLRAGAGPSSSSGAIPMSMTSPSHHPSKPGQQLPGSMMQLGSTPANHGMMQLGSTPQHMIPVGATPSTSYMRSAMESGSYGATPQMSYSLPIPGSSYHAAASMAGSLGNSHMFGGLSPANMQTVAAAAAAAATAIAARQNYQMAAAANAAAGPGPSSAAGRAQRGTTGPSHPQQMMAGPGQYYGGSSYMHIANGNGPLPSSSIPVPMGKAGGMGIPNGGPGAGIVGDHLGSAPGGTPAISMSFGSYDNAYPIPNHHASRHHHNQAAGSLPRETFSPPADPNDLGGSARDGALADAAQNDDTMSLNPDPGDWDPLYSDDQLLDERAASRQGVPAQPPAAGTQRQRTSSLHDDGSATGRGAGGGYLPSTSQYSSSLQHGTSQQGNGLGYGAFQRDAAGSMMMGGFQGGYMHQQPWRDQPPHMPPQYDMPVLSGAGSYGGTSNMGAYFNLMQLAGPGGVAPGPPGGVAVTERGYQGGGGYMDSGSGHGSRQPMMQYMAPMGHYPHPSSGGGMDSFMAGSLPYSGITPPSVDTKHFGQQ